MIGRKVDGRFTITAHLGSGGVGTVYRALQHSIDRDVALKLLRPEHLSDDEAVRRFFREARAASRLNNPHIISVFDFGQSSDGQFYMAMELLKGRSLWDLLESMPGPMEATRAVRLVDQVLEAVEEAHREGVLHRDLKTDNVFVLDEPPDFVKVLDFGLAKSTDIDDPGVTKAGRIVGTPAYMSPEQACGKDLDHRSDLYSVGTILFELLTGRLPFDDFSAMALILRKVREPAPAMAKVAPEVKFPQGLDDLLVRLLSIDPDLRPSSAAEVRRVMRAAVDPAGDSVMAGTVTPADIRGSPSVKPAPVASPASLAIARNEAPAMLAKAIEIAGEGWKLYSEAVDKCTSPSGRDLFLPLMSEIGATSGLLRKAAGCAMQGGADWGSETIAHRNGDPAGRFEESVRTSIKAIQGDAHLGRALDAGMAFERRVVDFWELQILSVVEGVVPAFLNSRLAEAKDRVAALAEVKMRVLGLMRNAGFNSLYMRLAGLLAVQRVRAGEVVFREGDSGDSMLVVVAGRFRLEVKGRDGEPTPLAEIGPGDVVGEMTCLDPAPRSATVVAISDSEVCTVDRGTLAALRESDPATYVAVIRAVISQVADRVRETDLRIESMFHEIRLQPLALPGVAFLPPSEGSGDVPGLGRSIRAGCFDAGDLAVLGQVARTRMMHHGTWVCREGQNGNTCFILKSGRLEIVKQIGRDELTLAILDEGCVVGHIALVDSGARSASVRALGDCELLELDRPTFERLVDAHVPLAMRFQEQLAVTGIRQLRLADRWLTRLIRRCDEVRGDSPQAVSIPEAVSLSQALPVTEQGIGKPPDRDEDGSLQVVTYMRTALREWGMSLEDLDQVSVAGTRSVSQQ
jgi:serine/threonine protein kinase/CRP-like cAMP-binding protein